MAVRRSEKPHWPPPPRADTGPADLRPAAGNPLVHVATAPRHVLWVHDADLGGHIAYVSPSYERIWGRSVAGLYDDPREWLAGIHPDDRDRVCAAFDAWVADPLGHRYDVEFRVVRPDGVERWVRDSGHAVQLPDGRLQLTGIAEDFTERQRVAERLRRAHDELKRQHDRLTLVADSSPSIIHSLRRNPDGSYTVTYGLERLAGLYGVTPDTMAADPSCIASRIHPADLPNLATTMQASLREMVPWRRAYRYQHPERGELWLEALSMPVRDGNGAVVWHGTITDVTVQHRDAARILELNAELEARVATRTAELQQAIQELEAFSYSVSHDLQAPLRAIDGFSKIVLDNHGEALPDTGQRYLGIIRDSAVKMGQLIDDLLGFSRLGRQSITKRPTDMGMLVRDALETLAPMREGRTVDVQVGDLPPCDGDPAMLRQVWINLLSNALKYTRRREGASVEVGHDGTGYYVRDNGAGFDMAQAHKLFKVFERLHRADEFEGTGVGLAIVQRVVERHGGRMDVDAAPDRGATFRFTLSPPASPAA